MKSQTIVAYAVAFFGLVIGTEYGLRAAGFDHPLLYKSSAAGYELRPNQTSTRLGKTTHINALGLRGPDTTPLPMPGVTRVLSLGDSVANRGARISDAQAYPALLENEMKRAGVNAEVLNASSGGWAIENERGWLKEHGTLGASVIVLEVNEKDIDQVFADDAILDRNPLFPSHYPATAIGDVLRRYAAPAVGLSRPATDPGSTPTGVNLKAEADMLETVADIEKIASDNHARLILMYWDPHYGAPDVATVVARDKLFAWASANSVPIIRPNLSSRSDWKGFFRDHMHPTITANAIIAKQLAEVTGIQTGR